MASIAAIQHAMINDGCDICFIYQNVRCGLAINAVNSKYTYTAWYGERVKGYSSFETAVNDLFFDNQSLKTLVVHDSIKIEYC